MIFQNSGMYFWDKIGLKSNGKCHPSFKGSFFRLFCWKSDLGLSWRHLRGILGRLGKNFEPSWPSTWIHLGPQDGSGAAQEPPERSLQITQEASWSQEPPKSRPEPSKTPQGGAQTPSKPRFSSQHGGGNAAFAALKIYLCVRDCLIFDVLEMSCFWIVDVLIFQ